MRRHCLTLLISSILAGPVADGTTPPVVDGHTHQGLKATEGVIDTSAFRDLTSRGLQVVVHAVPVDRTPTTDLVGRLNAEMEWLRRARTFAPALPAGLQAAAVSTEMTSPSRHRTRISIGRQQTGQSST